MSTKKFAICIIFICISSIGVFLSLSGCVNTGTAPPVAHGHVYLHDNAVSGATIEATSANGTDHQSTMTDSNGAYTLNLTPATPYNVTATYQSLRHTIWPVYLDNKSDTFNITLTITPKSTIEGTGYATSAHPENHNLTASNFAINLNSTRDNTVISKLFNEDGRYSVDVEPNVTYQVNGTLGEMGAPPITGFFYHNYPWGYQPLGNMPQITVGSNETVLIDYIVAMP